MKKILMMLMTICIVACCPSCSSSDDNNADQNQAIVEAIYSFSDTYELDGEIFINDEFCTDFDGTLKITKLPKSFILTLTGVCNEDEETLNVWEQEFNYSYMNLQTTQIGDIYRISAPIKVEKYSGNIMLKFDTTSQILDVIITIDYDDVEIAISAKSYNDIEE